MDFVTVNVSNSGNDHVAFEIKFAMSTTIAQLKSKLEIITGGNAATMSLELYNGDKLVCPLLDDHSMLGAFPIKNGMRIHVIDSFESLSAEAIEKFQLSEAEYDSKNDTVRHFLKRHQLGKYNEEELQLREKKRQELKKEMDERAALCVKGARCEITTSGNPIRRGTIMYNGPIDGKDGIFIGVKYDEPLGKNDGSINGRRYFECGMNYGGFVSPMCVKVGDFPPEACELDEI